MKPIVSLFLFLLLLLGTAVSTTALAQSEAAAIDTLAVDIWPDFDRPAVLVLYTGSLPAAQPLPAAVTLPLPPDAELNAVARITAEGVMTDDVDFTENAAGVSFTTPDRQFRVEYYMPYSEDGTLREFDFTWQADIPVNQFEVAVQEPRAAANLHTQPIAATVMQDSSDGFTYHILPDETLAEGETYAVNVTYNMDETVLSVNAAPPADIAPQTPPQAPPAAVQQPINWPLYLVLAGLLLIGIALVWQFSSRRQRRVAKPAPARSKSKPAGKGANFCHECGTRLNAGDKFCRKCGTAVK